MDLGGTEKSKRAVDVVLDKIKEQPEFLRWDREINGRLYYALWILFMGGFVLSIGQTSLPNVSSVCLIRQILNLFRSLAVIGSAINFIFQNLAINSVRYSRELSIDMDLHKAFAEDNQEEEAMVALGSAEKLRKKLTIIDWWISALEYCLWICGLLFLALSLYITWGIIPTTTGR
jgi:hypothetical protein